ncbi:MAG: hypothetical protein ACYC3X_24615 [Pirellulaceae bacterium]
MRHLLRSSVTAGLCCLLWAATVGCGDTRPQSSTPPGREPSTTDTKTDEHGHAQAPSEAHTFAAGVAALHEHYEEIKAAFAQGDAAKADEPLHHVGSLLESLPELAKTAALSTVDAEKLNQSVQTMFEAYGKIDEAIHQSKEADYPAVAEQLDQSMTAIRSLPTSPTPLPASPPPAEK